MEVNAGKHRPLDAGFTHVEHASRFILRKLQRCGFGRRRRLILSSRTRGPADLTPTSCDQAHSIQPLTPIDHVNSSGYCPGSSAGVAISTGLGCPLTEPCQTLPPKVVM